jgi:hypothetical protein
MRLAASRLRWCRLSGVRHQMRGHLCTFTDGEAGFSKPLRPSGERAVVRPNRDRQFPSKANVKRQLIPTPLNIDLTSVSLFSTSVYGQQNRSLLRLTLVYLSPPPLQTTALPRRATNMVYSLDSACPHSVHEIRCCQRSKRRMVGLRAKAKTLDHGTLRRVISSRARFV